MDENRGTETQNKLTGSVSGGVIHFNIKFVLLKSIRYVERWIDLRKNRKVEKERRGKNERERREVQVGRIRFSNFRIRIPDAKVYRNCSKSYLLGKNLKI